MKREDLNQERFRDLEKALKRAGRKIPQKTLFIDMDGTLVNFQSGIDCLDEKTRMAFVGHYDGTLGIFALMEPMPGALDAYTTLCQYFDTYILGTAPWENPTAWSDKLL